jgi:alcohol-forming fatty acyl-CoA reductase
LKNDAFDRLREQFNARQPETFDEMTARRITAVTGDVSTDGLGLSGEDRAIFASCDVIIHSAATVSFDSPLDSAVEINLLGPTRIAPLQRARGHPAPRRRVDLLRRRQPARQRPRAARQRGPVRHRARLAHRGRRRPPPQGRHRGAQPRARPARRVPQGSPRRARCRRRTGAGRQDRAAPRALGEGPLVEAGRARAASLGWPDAYAYTKALGEQALTETKGDVPVSIVRPSIIESAWAEPKPGWIRGFRMAEPVIISYARGLLKEFPGVPEGTVDVIPVDMVVAAIIAVAGGRPRAGAVHHPGGVGRHQPAQVPHAGRQRERLVHPQPDLRQRGPADRGARVDVPRPRAGCRRS